MPTVRKIGITRFQESGKGLAINGLAFLRSATWERPSISSVETLTQTITVTRVTRL